MEHASLARPKGSPPLERCLACEAVVSKGTIVIHNISQLGLPAIS
jgi:hypothetical protein